MRKLLPLIALLCLAGVLSGQKITWSNGTGVIGGTHAANDVLCGDGSGMVACATGNFYWNSGLFVDGGPLTLDPDGGFGITSGVCFGDADTCIYESGDDDLRIVAGTSHVRFGAGNLRSDSTDQSAFLIKTIIGTELKPSYSWSGDNDTGIWSPAAGTIAFT